MGTQNTLNRGPSSSCIQFLHPGSAALVAMSGDLLVLLCVAVHLLRTMLQELRYHFGVRLSTGRICLSHRRRHQQGVPGRAALEANGGACNSLIHVRRVMCNSRINNSLFLDGRAAFTNRKEVCESLLCVYFVMSVASSLFLIKKSCFKLLKQWKF